MKQIYLAISFLLSLATAQSIDVQKYNLHLRVSITGDSLDGYTDVIFRSGQANLTSVQLELYKFSVDSIVQNKTKLAYTYPNDSLLQITLIPLALNEVDTVRVYYHGVRGTAQRDPGGLGGFYNSGEYAFATGLAGGGIWQKISFASSWFPCVDNFTDKAIFEFFIDTEDEYVAVCNGVEVSNTTAGGLRSVHYEMTDTIAPYHANVIAGPMTKTVRSLSMPAIDLIIHSRNASSAALTATLDLLEAQLGIFEADYGPYAWDHVGYTYCPTGGFALENPTNVAMSDQLLAAASGSQHVNVLAHELAHHWFGNLITCQQPSMMWLNEGFARWNESYFREKELGVADAREHLETSHRGALNYGHVIDKGFFAVGNIPYQVTYGNTTYEKGATVAQTLRHQIGDAAYFPALQALFNSPYRWKNVNNDQFRDFLAAQTGQDLNDFFAKWVMQPGWVVFRLDSVRAVASGPNTNLTLHVGQGLFQKTDRSNNFLLEVGFVRPDLSLLLDTIRVGGTQSTATYTLPFEPRAVVLDPNERVLDGSLHRQAVITTPGNHLQRNTGLTLEVSALSSDLSLHTHYMYANPTQAVDTLYMAANCWRIDLATQPNSTASYGFRFDFDATESFIARDLRWFRQLPPHLRAVQQLRLFYRPNAGTAWQLVPNQVLSTAPVFDFTTTIRVPGNPPEGEYAFGVFAWPTSRNQAVAPAALLHLYPVPARHELHVQWEGDATQVAHWQVTDLAGRSLAQYPATQATIGLDGLGSGLYVLQGLRADGQAVVARRFQVLH